MGKWIDKHTHMRRAPGSSSKNKKILAEPDIAAAGPQTRKYGFQQHTQSASWRTQGDTSNPRDAFKHPPDMVQTQGAALRQTAWVHTTPLRLPSPPQGSVVCPPPQLPTLLQKSALRKKPPLQGVPPQESPLVLSRKGPARQVTWNETLGNP